MYFAVGVSFLVSKSIILLIVIILNMVLVMKNMEFLSI